jgi:hypothetical protein
MKFNTIITSILLSILLTTQTNAENDFSKYLSKNNIN